MKQIKKVAGIILNDNGRNILCLQKKGLAPWISPGGKIEPGETHEDCLRRELKEELNLTLGFYSRSLKVEDPVLTSRGIAEGTTDTEITIHFYHAYVIDIDKIKPQNEILYFVWAPISLYRQLPLAWSLKNELLPKLYGDYQAYTSRTGGS